MELSLTENKQLLRIDSATEMELEQLNISLNRRIESWRFNPLVKKGLWDGYISYIKDDKWIPAGLWREVMNICKQYGYELNLDRNEIGPGSYFLVLKNKNQIITKKLLIF